MRQHSTASTSWRKERITNVELKWGFVETLTFFLFLQLPEKNPFDGWKKEEKYSLERGNFSAPVWFRGIEVVVLHGVTKKSIFKVDYIV